MRGGTSRFCFECITRWSETENSCPMCKERFIVIKRKRLPGNEASAEPGGSGSGSGRAAGRKRSRQEAAATDAAGAAQQQPQHEDEDDSDPDAGDGPLKRLKGTVVETRVVQERKQVWRPADLLGLDLAALRCQVCSRGDDDQHLLICDGCDRGYHTYCVELQDIPEAATAAGNGSDSDVQIMDDGEDSGYGTIGEAVSDEEEDEEEGDREEAIWVSDGEDGREEGGGAEPHHHHRGRDHDGRGDGGGDLGRRGDQSGGADAGRDRAAKAAKVAACNAVKALLTPLYGRGLLGKEAFKELARDATAALATDLAALGLGADDLRPGGAADGMAAVVVAQALRGCGLGHLAEQLGGR
ncbi:hypothetical protein GPECTOR_17g789 [Gonium pectorale]|uniref:PHD-type domain-containing protein n=1 Tax=Gonium pectorale TaxID=33097 RepID=A0A150GK06_GONPE|nr:hypothetical protein GPECTOR_17g789 [Gonium pectorale]|eukprot:KXZ50153.1 hypothetical protein GPECTOR_17g789 [Gonium pectorale]